MTKKEVEILLRKGRLPYNSDFWYNSIVGTILTTSIWGGLGTLIGNIMGIERIWLFPYLLLLLLFVLYKYWKDEKLIFYKTFLSKEDNIRILEETLIALDWKYHKYSNEISLTESKYILKWLVVKIIPIDNEIAYNFQYSSSSQGAKLAFFIGIRTYLKMKFEKKLHTTIHCQKSERNIET